MSEVIGSPSTISPSTITTTDNHDTVPFEIISKPSATIKTFQDCIVVDENAFELILVTMKRSFLLVIKKRSDNTLTQFTHPSQGDKVEETMSEDMLVQSFMNQNLPLKGLSLAIGEHSTCLKPSDNSLASTSLASRLSKKLNNGQPVYVASDIQVSSQDTCDLSDFMSKFYLKIFQFVRVNLGKAHSGNP